jgi:hypothetical protein
LPDFSKNSKNGLRSQAERGPRDFGAAGGEAIVNAPPAA